MPLDEFHGLINSKFDLGNHTHRDFHSCQFEKRMHAPVEIFNTLYTLYTLDGFRAATPRINP